MAPAAMGHVGRESLKLRIFETEKVWGIGSGQSREWNGYPIAEHHLHPLPQNLLWEGESLIQCPELLWHHYGSFSTSFLAPCSTEINNLLPISADSGIEVASHLSGGNCRWLPCIFDLPTVSVIFSRFTHQVVALVRSDKVELHIL